MIQIDLSETLTSPSYPTFYSISLLDYAGTGIATTVYMYMYRSPTQ